MAHLAPGAQHAVNKRTIMSGVVRRQTGQLNKTMTGLNETEMSAEGPGMNATADGAVNQSGVISANRISFYPTSPQRQSYMQPGNKAFYGK